MKILVTGGAGFIGSHTVVELFNNGDIPIIIDDFRNSEPFILERIKEITGNTPVFYNLDCLDLKGLETVFEKEKPEGVVHFAAYKAVGESVQNPLMYYENNICSLMNLLKLAPIYNAKYFVFSSSCTVYGNPEIIPVTEGSPIQEASSPYGYTKQVCEKMLQDFCKVNQSIKTVLLRYFNPIGAHPSGLIGELPNGVPNNLVPYVSQTAAGLRDQLTINGGDYNTSDGTCIRDYIHVSDLADAHVKAFTFLQNETSNLHVFNVGTGNGSTVLEVVSAFEKATKAKVKYTIGPRREGDVVSVFADNRKIVTELKWMPRFSLEEALSHAWKWQQSLND
jgi:UDP-glucose 4-epimerase